MVDRDDAASAADPEPRPVPEPEGTATPGAHRVPTLSREAAVSPGTDRRPTIPREETARLGDEIYERYVRPQVEDEHHGEYVAIDVDSGGWAVSDDLLVAAASLRAEHPEAVNVWGLRVGYRALRHFGGRPLRGLE